MGNHTLFGTPCIVDPSTLFPLFLVSLKFLHHLSPDYLFSNCFFWYSFPVSLFHSLFFSCFLNNSYRSVKRYQMGIEELEEKENVVLPQPPDDRDASDRIEQVASVVAWTPAAELFLRQLMLGNEDFKFMNPESVYYAYYRLRVEVLRRRPCRLYSLRG